MNMRSVPDPLPATAEDWVARLQSPDCSAQEHEAFEDWLAADARNPAAYADAERLFAMSAELRRDPQLAAQARNARRRADGGRRRSWPFAMAAAVALAGVIGYRVLFVGADAPQHLQTAIGERRESVLADGSRLTLDADTAVDVAYARRERALTLVRGRVQIEAASDADRPMIVHAANGSVRVVGTTFQVQHLGGRVEVGLLHGAVAVTTGRGRRETLAEGQQLSYGRDGDIGPVRPLSSSEAQAWTRGLLAFSDKPLDTIVQEANRYSATRIRLADPALGSIPVSGAFQAGDQDALADALVAGWGLHADRDANGDIILRRR
ncbi:FecR domain-containing protein [Luteimonas sp. Y-2-2-4F]|nr:FecR domain-containing protein [Luteimonas sp. Y-2-2-4F]MCD9030991.1 FecR domain-containing protein [Luteimonas sp. Y-2-2-4F]